MRLKSNLMESIINNIKESDDHDKSNYMMLSRLKSDCDYYLGNGNRNPRNLWAGDEAKQIAKMREYYDKVPEEPEWLTKEDIDSYEDKMINGSEDSPENHIENPTVIEDKNSLKEDNEEAEDITYILDDYNGEVDFVTKEELGLDYSYRVLITNVSEAQNYNYHSDYWGNDTEYQEQNVDLMWQLEKYVGKTVKIKFEDTTVYAKLIGILIDKQYNSIDHTKILIEPINMNESSQESSLKDNRNNVIKELSSIIEGAELTYEEVFEDIHTRAGENSELIDIILSNMLKDYKEYLGEATKIATKYNLKEDSYEDSLFTDIEAALNQYGFDVTRYTDAGMMTKNIGWIVSNSEGEVNLTCAGTYLDESSVNDSSNIKEIEKYIKGSTLNDAAKFLGMYFHGDADSFEVQGSEIVDKKHKDNRIACSMDGDKIASIASDLSNLKEDSIVSENDQYRAMLVDLMEDDNTKQEIINCIDKEDKIIGSVSYTVYKDSNEYHVYNIVVSPEYRRKGVGTFLLKSLQDVVGDNDIYFDTLTPSGKALLDKIASYDKYKEGKLGANLYKGKIN